MPDHKITVGNVEIVSLTDGQADMDPLTVFLESSLADWQSYPDLFDENNRIHPRFGVFAVRSGGKQIIVDTGLGGPNGKLMAEFKAKGVDRNEIDLVVLTHLHGDHIGWNLTDGSLTFPNARYLVSQKDWDYWTQPERMANTPVIGEQALPLEKLNVLDLIDDGYRITDELTTMATPGHTPGHTSVMIASGGQRGIILGDVAHTPVQAHHPDWSPVFDVDGDLSRQTRHRVMDRLETEGYVVSSGHFPAPGFGRFVRAEGRRIWQGI